MATDIAVFLPCEHWATVSHVQGDRMTMCPTCHAEYVVRAEPVNTIRYLVLDEDYDPETGRVIHQQWRTIADIQAEIEARQNVEAKQHAIEDGLATREEMFPPIEDESHELDCPVYQSPEPRNLSRESHAPEYCEDVHPGMKHGEWIRNVPYKVGDIFPPNPRVGDQLESD